MVSIYVKNFILFYSNKINKIWAKDIELLHLQFDKISKYLKLFLVKVDQ